MEKIKAMFKWLKRQLQKNGGKIAYYSAVMAALSAIAIAAEQYRGQRNEAAEALILPAVEMEVSAPVEESVSLQIPDGAVCMRGYSRNPQWNAALEQWENHLAVDYRCPDEYVESVSAGTVRTIGKSGLYGGFVEIESGEYLIRYASIEPADELEPGAQVAAGELIGTADASMAGEGYMGNHLHLELYKMDESIDFAAEAEKNTSISD